MDLTPNYVTENDELFKEALKSEQASDDQFLSAFVTSDSDQNNWLKVDSDKKAWTKHGNRFFLSQFGNNYDLQLSSPVAQHKLTKTLEKLIDLGVKGFRLNNAKHFAIASDRTDDLPDTEKTGENMDSYKFYKHLHTTNQPELGDIIRVFTQFVHNKTGGEGFLTIRDDAAERVENYVIKNTTVLGFDLPRAAFLNQVQSSSAVAAKRLHSGFDVLKKTVNLETLWMQVPYESLKTGLDAVAYNMFMSLLPGVQVGSLESLNASNESETFKKLQVARENPVFQHGSFDILLSQNDTAFAYTR
jgi:glycosidase